MKGGALWVWFPGGSGLRRARSHVLPVFLCLPPPSCSAGWARQPGSGSVGHPGWGGPECVPPTRRSGRCPRFRPARAMLSLDFLDDVRRMNKRQLYYQVLNFGMIVSSALMIWKGLMVVTGSESPIVVVLSGSMEPAFHRGDLLFLTNRIEDPIRVGEIVVFKIEGREIPIVHRVLKIHERQDGHIKFLTKGDNNAVDDRGLYKQGQLWLEKKDVVGRARGFVPYIGIVTILMNDYPKFKYAVLFLLGLFVLVHRE
ncbi:signal peptidase complex catalytic subunit SEC11A isoform X1 [Monodelphis domestica]|uniref:Signal peptidase complex catalytic subunit SEC11 n=4 Tax=Metatheria TaxID=9263 RepID=F6WTI9_MONDO|nr:signal peptidase complex catalytic subunit SEC11A isoform X1 [Monodelphis domestica]